jgi:hypothetical protein
LCEYDLRIHMMQVAETDLLIWLIYFPLLYTFNIISFRSFKSLRAISPDIARKLFGPQADVTILHRWRIDCDATIKYVYFDVAFKLLRLILNPSCFYSFTQ